jgi:hypothetical protein
MKREKGKGKRENGKWKRKKKLEIDANGADLSGLGNAW